jgi:hypothetical protein
MECTPNPTGTETVARTPHLARVLTLWDLIHYGMITVSLVAPVTVFGLAVSISHGHAIAALLNAMIATVLTAFSYGRRGRPESS